MLSAIVLGIVIILIHTTWQIIVFELLICAFRNWSAGTNVHRELQTDR